jgi:hypothetical protein
MADPNVDDNLHRPYDLGGAVEEYGAVQDRLYIAEYSDSENVPYWYKGTVQLDDEGDEVGFDAEKIYDNGEWRQITDNDRKFLEHLFYMGPYEIQQAGGRRRRYKKTRKHRKSHRKSRRGTTRRR